MLAHPPPYALHSPSFRCRALAALAGRAALGGPRETALACFVATRLVAAALPPLALPVELRAARAIAARTWLASLALPAPLRIPASRVVEASAGDDLPAMSRALRTLAGAAAGALDPAAEGELEQLAGELEGWGALATPTAPARP